MSEAKASYNRILKSTSIIGGAAVINIVVGVLRTKVLAVLLGPVGIGLVSLFNGLITTVSSFVTCGIGPVGTRQIADAHGKNDLHALLVVRRAMMWGTLFFSVTSGLAVWLLRHYLAVHTLGNESYSGVVGWLGIGVALTIAGTSQTALIQGMRRIGDVALLNVSNALLSTILGIAILWKWGRPGLVAFVLIMPLAAFVLGHYFVKRIPGTLTGATTWRELRTELKVILVLAMSIVGAGVVQSVTQLWVRVDIAAVLGANALGQYQAAWTISMQYVGFVLLAMGADYYPRLTSVVHKPEEARQLVNEQTEIALLLSGPVFIAMMALAPFVIRLLYAKTFAPSAEILRWQVMGDVLKIPSWALGFLILAAGDGFTFFLTESFAWIAVTAMIVLGIPHLGLPATGMAYLGMYMLYLPLVYWLAYKRVGFRWSRAVTALIGITIAACLLTVWLTRFKAWGCGASCGMAICFALFSLRRIAEKSSAAGAVRKLGQGVRSILSKIKNANAFGK